MPSNHTAGQRNEILWAAARADVTRLSVLLEQGVPVDGSDYPAPQTDLPETTPLFACVTGGKDTNGYATRLLLAKGADADRRLGDGWTVLMIASMTGQPAVVEALLEFGCDVNAQNKDGTTALHQSVANDRPTIVRMLLDAGADPLLRTNSGRTAVDSYRIRARRLHHTEILDLLYSAIERGTR